MRVIILDPQNHIILNFHFYFIKYFLIPYIVWARFTESLLNIMSPFFSHFPFIISILFFSYFFLRNSLYLPLHLFYFLLLFFLGHLTSKYFQPLIIRGDIFSLPS